MKPTKQSLTYHGLSSYLRYAAKYKVRIGLVALGYAVAIGLTAAMPIFVGLLVGELASPQTSDNLVFMWTGTLIGLSILHHILWHISEFAYTRYIIPPIFAYEKQLMQQVLSKPYSYYTEKFTGKIAANIDTVSRATRQFSVDFFYTYVTESVRIVSIALILTTVNIQTVAVFIGGIALMIYIGLKTYKPFMIAEKKLTDDISSKTGWIVDTISNFSNLKSFHTEQRELASHAKKTDSVATQGRQTNKEDILFWLRVGAVVRWGIWPITIVMNVILYQQGQLSITQLTTLLATILLFSDFIWGIIGSILKFSINISQLEEAYTYLVNAIDTPTKSNIKTTHPSHTPTFSKGLSIHNLSFSYPDRPEEAILNSISLSIKKGEKIGIVGKSGSGKSTLTKILLGYFSVEKGAICVDDQPVTSRDFSNLISFVPQDPTLFHRTIEENIAYAALQNPTHEEILQAAKLANAHEFIMSTENGYQSLVGERGIKLSGGQKQRIAIARAILRKAPIQILDEATSALDSESEKLIQASLDNLMQNQTTIIIAHRLSTIAKLDRIVVLEKGTIVEQGSHKDLLKKNGQYAKLWTHQSGGFIEE